MVDRSAPGRGAWLHPTESCIGALRPGDLARAFRRTVSPDEMGGAIAACRAVGLTDDEIRDGLANFPGLAHRMQPVARLGSVIFVNDSKATNAEASAPALKTFDHIHWIAGGRPKEGGIGTLAPFFPKIARAYLIGEAAEAFSTTLSGAADTVICGTLENAVKQAADDAAKSKAETPVVLLSPACASFDQFASFEERGERFRDIAQDIAGRGIGGNEGTDGNGHPRRAAGGAF